MSRISNDPCARGAERGRNRTGVPGGTLSCWTSRRLGRQSTARSYSWSQGNRTPNANRERINAILESRKKNRIHPNRSTSPSGDLNAPPGLGENGVLATCLTPSGVGVLSGTLVCATDLGTRRILRPKILPGAPAALTSTQAAGTPNTSAVAARTVVGVTCGSRTRTLPASFMAKASTSVNIRIAAASAAVDAATTASAKAFAASTARGAAFSKTAPAAPRVAVISGSAASWSAVASSMTYPGAMLLA
mmetsp:Transcript_9079/g.35453  ORF Transcript_9079/g.35453 Transcript_9079/m.35453 type:complete len:248 (-) Transcript_9079:249-992(-)